MKKSSMLQSFGVPKYYLARNFEGKFTEYSKKNSIITPIMQRKKFKQLMTEDPGWLAYVTAPGLLFNAGILAADIAQNYLDNKLRIHWFNHFDASRNSTMQDHILSSNLVVFDTLFYDGSRLNRDLLYATISRYCQRDDCSVLVIGQAPSPVNMVTYLGLPPNFVFQVN